MLGCISAYFLDIIVIEAQRLRFTGLALSAANVVKKVCMHVRACWHL
jgi:hypothetical protein